MSSPGGDANLDMTKATDTVIITSDTAITPDSSVKNEKKKKSIIPRLFGAKRTARESSESDGDGDLDLEKKIEERKKAFMEAAPMMRKSFSERHTSPGIQSLNLSNFEQHSMLPSIETKEFRIFVATWNVGGKSPNNGLNLEDFLQVEGSSDIYVLGFQEIVPLSAGNVLVIEDNEPAAKWLTLISQALNKPQNACTNTFCCSSDSSSHGSNKSSHNKESKSPGSLNFFQKPSLKVISKSFRADSRILKSCNCPFEFPSRERRRLRKLSDPADSKLDSSYGSCDGRVDEFLATAGLQSLPSSEMSYSLITSKKMVGIFVSVWVRRELVQHVGHLRVSTVGRGIMGCLGNKGCISISMTLHQTSFCFVCSHLASGEKEGDELKRNADVVEILKGTQFPKICKNPNRLPCERIVDHDRVIWLGDLNYRVALSYEETRVLLEDNDWDALLEKDQLNIEREAGRVFDGFKEGQIYFAPTYKYSHNSDSYAGETAKSKKKRRTPAWCDRILWRGEGFEQLSYIRGESRFSDHRPVCAVFSVEVNLLRSKNNRFRKGYSCAAPRFEFDACMPQRHSFYEL
ncbi:putative inositol-polyphosphate 5-phosphatase [Rosa chinensis]|uniref:Putative inositol-polyphosphate 5-phosphatase n=1 Tax=Rosa chinensis TaxID=74649 RepID=A0A2P6RQX0_ROSCH|nr:type I inositol polyphosphate 5-phosphatase 5 isoform X2 [Rosa chinensis]PRQ48832.1 putative inositol-polyphosphate 5-phosphatase [Rosa chinensis]